MYINPQTVMQILAKGNPQFMQQFQQFQQQLKSNAQLMQEYNKFKNNFQNNPQMQEKILSEAFSKMGMGASNPTQK